MGKDTGIRDGLKGNVDEALRLFSSEREWAGLNVDETEFVLEETLKCYGSTFDGEMIRSIFVFYRRYVGLASVARRQQLLSRMTAFISEGRQNRSIALLCFISADPDGQISSGAALDLSMVMTPDKGDPLTGPKFVAFHGCGGVRAKLGQPGSDEEGDVAAGLLLLGDMRLLPLLEEIWERLTPEARRRMVRRRSNLATKLAVEFLVRRLEADVAQEHHGELAAFLHDLPGIAARQPVAAILDVRRNFGLPAGKEPMELIGQEEISEAYGGIRGRLELLIQKEADPKVLPDVRAAWAGHDAAESEDEEIDERLLDHDERYPDISSQELFDEFEANAENDNFEGVSEDIYFWQNPYRTKDIDAEQLEEEFAQGGRVVPLLITGIFNPFGPTLNIYLVQPDDFDPGRSRMSLFMLNPFSCTKSDLGMLDEARVRLNFGTYDEIATERTKRMAYRGRDMSPLRGTLEYLMKFALGRSRILPSFTLCQVLPVHGREDTLAMVAALYEATEKGRDDFEDLSDNKKRKDPWSRADMDEVMRRAMNPETKKPPRRLTSDEAQKMARIVMDPEQQRLELLNIILAWDGAIKFNPNLKPVLERDTLVQLLSYLTADLPGLLRLDPKERDGETAKTEKAKADESTPKYEGFLSFLMFLSACEMMAAPFAFIWGLICTEWILSLALVVFLLFLGAKFVLMSARKTAARWFGVFNYSWILTYAAYRIDAHDHGYQMGPAGLLLVKILAVWSGVMLLVYLLYFRFAKSMREAPEGED